MSITFQKISSNLIILTILIFSVFILIHILFPMELISAISDNFNKEAIGIAALITAYFGSSYFREELSRKRSIKFYREKYPPQQHGKTYKFIESVKTPG